MKTKFKESILLSTLLFLLLASVACQQPDPLGPKRLPPVVDNSAGQGTGQGFEAAEVKRVIDGDTLEVTRPGKEGKERVRLIGVDTPETKHPVKPVEYYGKEATEFTQKRLEGKRVYLEQDTSDRDRYGRLLRYVWLEDPSTKTNRETELDKSCFNAILLEEGYAKIATFPPDVRYTAHFLELERTAREKKLGLWNKETSVQEAAVQGAANKIKGNRSSKIYHLPGSRHYDSIKEENAVYFNSIEEAEAAGYRPAQ